MDFRGFAKYVERDGPAYSLWRPPVGAGWHRMIHEALVKIDAIVGGDDSRFRIDQIEEEFGALRFYICVADDPIGKQLPEINDEIERQSAQMCETCGAAARIHNYGGWYGCLCPAHAYEMIEERRLKIDSAGWRLGRIEDRVVLIDMVAGRESGAEKLAEVEANMFVLTQEADAPVPGRRSAIGNEARSEVADRQHATFVAQ